MRRSLLLLLFCCTLSASQSQYEEWKTQARKALAHGDLDSAEQSLIAALRVAESSNESVYDVYANVVTPLADLYRKQEKTGKLEELYRHRVEHGRRMRTDAGLSLGMAQADLGFFYQNSEVSADRFHGERFVEQAMKTLDTCSTSKLFGEHCRRRLADTAGIQGAIYFQALDYARAEPLFRRVLAIPESQVQAEVLFVSLHALRGILILRKENAEAADLEKRATLLEASKGEALERLTREGARGRSR